MEILVNGKSTELSDGMNLADLLRQHDLPPTRVAIELNRQIVSRKQYAETQLKRGDQVEIVTFVGGG